MNGTTAQSFTWTPPPDTGHREVASCQMLALGEIGNATLTIAVPTYRRPDLLIETVRSVLAQTRREALVLVVVDNDPDSRDHERLLAALPELAGICLRYYRNAGNVGMFGNWNKCIDLAQTAWLSILNDDDLLDPTFAAIMMDFVAAHGDVDAVICSKRWIDQRGTTGDVVMHEEDGIGRKLLGRLRFGGRNWRAIRPRALFFANVVGNSVGMVVRSKTARSLGGFRSAEFPSADYYFNVRLARTARFVQLRQVLASVRIAQNESCKPATVIGFLSQGRDLQRMLAEDAVPRWWVRLIPGLLRIAIDDVNALWHTTVTPGEVAAALRTPVPARASRILRFGRNILPDLRTGRASER